MQAHNQPHTSKALFCPIDIHNCIQIYILTNR